LSSPYSNSSGPAAAYVVGERTATFWRIAGRCLLLVPTWLALWVFPLLALDLYADWCERVPEAPPILEHTDDQSVDAYLSSEGIRLGGGDAGRRPWVSIDDVPPDLIGAFIAAEDEGFFEHHGIDPWSIARALVTNVRRGHVAQGGSTITQQLAKMYVGQERTYDRKLREAMLARRIEQRYSKLEILEAYLNKIYLGAGANGVEAAAQTYFGRSLSELELHEEALLAGLTSAPSRLNPFHNPKGALQRRVYVLGRMEEMGLIDAPPRQQADAKPLLLDRRSAGEFAAPYVAQEVRRQLRALENQENSPLSATAGSRIVESTVSLALQQRAVREVSRGARQMSMNRQDSAILTHLEPSELAGFVADARRTYGAFRVPGRTYLGVVVETAETEAWVDTGRARVRLDAEGLKWARFKPEPDAEKLKRMKRKPKPQTPNAIETFLHVGDLVQVEPRDLSFMGAEVAGSLVPVANIQGAVVSMEIKSGALRALAGGTGFDVSQYNRATRSCRQPGSAFKPILYAKAIERGLTPASMVHDFPVRYEDDAGHLIWEPRNSDRDFKGALLLVSALAKSRNLPAVKLIKTLGVGSVADLAKELGIDSPMRLTPSLALGASCVSPIELNSVYGTLARRGERKDPYLIRSVSTAAGELLYDHGDVTEPAGPIDARLHRLVRAARLERRQVLRPEVAYVTDFMLREAGVGGTGKDARKLTVPVAGKTGTTNRFDVWFAGFSADIVTSVWLGDDQNRASLGEGETGGTSALPVWMAYMEFAVTGRAQADPIDAPPVHILYRRIDPESGLVAHKDGEGLWMPFVEGTEPTEVATGPMERSADVADILDREF